MYNKTHYHQINVSEFLMPSLRRKNIDIYALRGETDF